VLSHFAAGSYRFVASPGRPFSPGIVADPGFDLVHAVFFRPVPLAAGLENARLHVEAAGRPAAALAAFELRIPEPLSSEGFDAFNEPYVEHMAALGLRSGDGSVTARTNVSPTTVPPSEPSLYAFTYTVPGGNRPLPAFRLSGAAETRSDGSAADRVRSILDALARPMGELGVTWEAATAINLYGASVAPFDEVASGFGPAALHGATWFPSVPPLRDLEFEIDVRGVGTEVVI
jgi:hypothetical protein